MNEQEPPNSILGFDPVTGRRIGDNLDELHPVGEVTPPSEIQTAFVEWVKNQPYTKGQELRIAPDRLFLAIKSKWKVNRIYFTWNQTLSPEEQTFPRHTQAEITDSVLDKDHKYEPFALHYFDEHVKEGEDRNSISLRYSNLRESIILLGVHVWLVKDGRTLYVEDLENVPEIRFTELDGKQDIFELDLARQGYYDLSKLVLEDTKERVVLVHNGKKFVDIVEILKAKDERAILDRLFEDAILNEPYGVTCDFDDSWRTADIRDITGIKWKMEEKEESKVAEIARLVHNQPKPVEQPAKRSGFLKRLFKRK